MKRTIAVFFLVAITSLLVEAQEKRTYPWVFGIPRGLQYSDSGSVWTSYPQFRDSLAKVVKIRDSASVYYSFARTRDSLAAHRAAMVVRADSGAVYMSYPSARDSLAARRAEEAAIRLVQANDSTYKAAQLLLRILYSDTTDVTGKVITREQARIKHVAKVDTTTEAGGSYVTPTQRKADTTYNAAQHLLRMLYTDTTDVTGKIATREQVRKLFTSTICLVYADSASIVVGDTIWADLPRYTTKGDSISASADFGGGAAVNISPKFFYRTMPAATPTVIVNTPGAITQTTVKTKWATLDASTYPAGGQIGITFTAAVTKPKTMSVAFECTRTSW